MHAAGARRGHCIVSATYLDGDGIGVEGRIYQSEEDPAKALERSQVKERGAEESVVEDQAKECLAGASGEVWIEEWGTNGTELLEKHNHMAKTGRDTEV